MGMAGAICSGSKSTFGRDTHGPHASAITVPPIRLLTHSSILCKMATMVQRASHVDETENHPAKTPNEVYDHNGRRRELGDKLRGTQLLHGSPQGI